MRKICLYGGYDGLQKIVSGVTLIATLLTASVVFNRCSKKEKSNHDIVQEYYGDNTYQTRAMDYIELSNQLHKLNLQKYNLTRESASKYTTLKELQSKDVIEGLIESYKTSKINKKNVLENSDNMVKVANLFEQECLVNEYLRTEGYDTANWTTFAAARDYISEKYDIDPNSLDFHIIVDKSDGYSYRMTFIDNSQEYNKPVKEKIIKEAIMDLYHTDTKDDKNPDDDYKYNKDRNKFISDALAHSVKVFDEIFDKNLYDEKAAQKIKK